MAKTGRRFLGNPGPLVPNQEFLREGLAFKIARAKRPPPVHFPLNEEFPGKVFPPLILGLGLKGFFTGGSHLNSLLAFF